MAKIMHEKLNLSSGSPIKIKWCDYDYFKFPWHFHEEFEIVYVLKSTGTRFVGNNIESFSDGDLVLLGSSVPHMYRNDIQYYQNDPDKRVYAVTLQFSKDFFQHSLDKYPEFSQIKKLLEEAQYGVYFYKNANGLIRRKITKALHLTGLELLLETIIILSLMSKSKDKRLLSDESEKNLDSFRDNDPREVKVKAFLHREYTRRYIAARGRRYRRYEPKRILPLLFGENQQNLFPIHQRVAHHLRLQIIIGKEADNHSNMLRGWV